MRLNSLLILATTSGVFAGQFSPLSLNKRQVQVPCSDLGMKVCGRGCIYLSETCCPSGSGGCPLGSYCSLQDNGDYGCCPIGRVCDGNAGVSTRFLSLTSTLTSTQIMPPPEEPTQRPTQEPEPEEHEPEEVPPTETKDPEVPEETIPPVPLPTPVPSNGTVPPADTTGEPPVATAAAAINGFAMSNVIGGLIGAAVLFL